MAIKVDEYDAQMEGLRMTLLTADAVEARFATFEVAAVRKLFEAHEELAKRLGMILRHPSAQP